VVPSHFTLHPKGIKLKDWLFKDEPWPLRGFCHSFSFQSVKQALVIVEREFRTKHVNFVGLGEGCDIRER
jgi:hypothetical protein